MKEKKDVQELLLRQREFFASGETLSYAFRRQQLTKLKQAVLAWQGELEQGLKADLGKSAGESYLTEIGFVLAGISHTLRQLKRWMKPEKVGTPIYLFSAKSKIIKEPYGSVLILGPYNYPVQLLLEPLVAALAAGNCAVLSPSELTPHTASVIKKLIDETFPPDYVYCAEGGIEQNTLLLNSPFDYIFFTGSVRVGKIVMEAAAQNLVPVTLELGGKSPVLVDATANLAVAAERIVWGKLLNAGQTCVAPDYVLADRRVFEPFIAELKRAIVRLYGEDIRHNAAYGRIVNAGHMRRLQKILETDGDSIVYGGKADESERFLEPTILCPKSMDAACMQEELFGPILPVFPYERTEEALTWINAHEKPLALYVFTEDKSFADGVIARTSSGGVSVNDTISHLINHDLPFGGVGTSGMGNYHGVYGFNTFSHHRSVLVRSTRFRPQIAFPPYTEKKLSMAKKFLK